MLYMDLGGAGQGASNTLWEPLRASGTSGTLLGASGSLWEPVDDFLYNGIHAQSGAHLGGKPLFTPEEARSTSCSGHAPRGFDWSPRICK